MNAATLTLFDQAAASWAAWMFEMAWQVTLLVVLLVAISMPLRRRSATFLYALWLLIVVRLVLPPDFAFPTGWGWWLRPEQAAVSAVGNARGDARSRHGAGVWSASRLVRGSAGRAQPAGGRGARVLAVERPPDVRLAGDRGGPVRDALDRSPPGPRVGRPGATDPRPGSARPVRRESPARGSRPGGGAAQLGVVRHAAGGGGVAARAAAPVVGAPAARLPPVACLSADPRVVSR